jgi:hypothetical protein
MKDEARQPQSAASGSETSQLPAQSEITPESYVFISYAYKDSYIVSKDIEWLES